MATKPPTSVYIVCAFLRRCFGIPKLRHNQLASCKCHHRPVEGWFVFGRYPASELRLACWMTFVITTLERFLGKKNDIFGAMLDDIRWFLMIFRRCSSQLLDVSCKFHRFVCRIQCRAFSLPMKPQPARPSQQIQHGKKCKKIHLSPMFFNHLQSSSIKTSDISHFATQFLWEV